MLSDEEKREYKELKSLLYTGTISQYGKRKLIDMFEKQSKEIEEAEQKERKAYIKGTNDADELCNKKWENKIKAKIEWLDKEGYFEFLSNRDILKCHNILASLLEKE